MNVTEANTVATIHRTMPPIQQFRIPASPEIIAAFAEYCAQHGEKSQAAWARLVLCREIGKPELVHTVKPVGKPTAKKAAAKKPRKKGD